MKNLSLARSLRVFFIASLVTMLIVSMVPAQNVHADGVTTTSDLKVKVISSPKTARACQTFKAKFSIKNIGPDPVTHLYVMTWLPDQLELVSLVGAPESLAVGQTVKFSAVIKVVAFVPGESRKAWVGAYAMSDPFPNISIDPNPENDWVSKPLKLISDPVAVCP